MQCCAAVRTRMEGRGERYVICSLKLPYLSTMSQQFCRQLLLQAKRKKITAPSCFKVNGALFFLTGLYFFLNLLTAVIYNQFRGYLTVSTVEQVDVKFSVCSRL